MRSRVEHIYTTPAPQGTGCWCFGFARAASVRGLGGSPEKPGVAPEEALQHPKARGAGCLGFASAA